LINAGANVNAIDDLQETPLHRAAIWGHAAVVEALLHAGADVNAADNHLNTPLHRAVEEKYTAVIHQLITAGANVNAQNDDQKTPLHLAVYYHVFTDDIRALVAAGADVHAVDLTGESVLDIARKRGDGVLALLEAHAAVAQRRQRSWCTIM